MFKPAPGNKRPMRTTRIGEANFQPSLVRKLSTEQVVQDKHQPLEITSLYQEAVEPQIEEKGDVKVRIGCVTQEGAYHGNEDRMTCGINLTDVITGYVGIFDGHGGEACSEYTSKVVSTHIKENFKDKESWLKGKDQVEEMFHDIEYEFTEIARTEDDTSGSCATVVLVNGFEVIVANIGDCRAVAVSPKGLVTVLTDDHRADSPSESVRIARAGGSVVNGRVFNLQPSRSFGDLDVKDVAGEDVVIPTPEVSSIKMEKNGFMIVATDGLWDSVSTKEAAKFAQKILRSCEYDPEVAADRLVQLALDKRATDDVTVAVLVW